MADDKTYSADEHLAVLEDRIKRETADLTAERDQLKTSVTDLESKLDIAESAKVAAEEARAKAEADLAAYKTEVEQREAAALRKDDRLKKVREVASHLPDTFFEDTKRVERIVAMSEDDFDGYVSDLADTNKVAGNTSHTVVPRETAMAGQQVSGGKPVAQAGKSFLMRQFIAPTTTKEG